MKHLTIIFLLTCLVSAFILAGCSASDESEKDQTTSSQTVPEKKADRTPPPAPAPKDSTKAEATTEVTQAPPKQTETVVSQTMVTGSGMPSGNFSVQIGAFSMQEKADQVASLARTRFSGKNVYELKDDKTSNTKVLLGDFTVKDDARKFRDEIVQQFPDDYQGAWVFDVPHN